MDAKGLAELNQSRLYGELPSTPPHLRLGGLAFGNGSFVAVGEIGAILQSGAIGPQPRFEVRNVRNSTIDFQLSSEPNTPLGVEMSDDLKTWRTLTNFNNATGTSQFIVAPTQGQRFYRATQME